jgi:hypothetical protein
MPIKLEPRSNILSNKEPRALVLVEQVVRTKILEKVSPSHDGVWNLFAEIDSTEMRQEILDWDRLKENLYKSRSPILNATIEDGRSPIAQQRYSLQPLDPNCYEHPC